MRRGPLVLAVLSCLLPAGIPAAVRGQESPPPPPPQAPRPATPSPSPLFQDHAPLTLTLVGDLRALLRDRGDEAEEHDMMLRYVTPGGDSGAVDVEVRTRGIFRLQRCAFPPLRLDFPRRRVEGTPFAGQDKVKLVTHCRPARSPYEQNVLQEYAVYRVLNVLTDSSFRARLARITYVDTTRADTVTRWAALLESDEEFGRRLGAEVLDQSNVHDLLMEAEHMTLVAVFQYLIGNTDWSVWGLHNITIMRDTTGGDEERRAAPPRLLALPFDFDFAGVINAPYATPAPQLSIKSVRERLYRGYCQPDELLERVLARFRAAKDSIYAVVQAIPDLAERETRDVVRYFDEFYRTIESPGAVQREFVRGCRRLPT